MSVGRYEAIGTLPGKKTTRVVELTSEFTECEQGRRPSYPSEKNPTLR